MELTESERQTLRLLADTIVPRAGDPKEPLGGSPTVNDAVLWSWGVLPRLQILQDIAHERDRAVLLLQDISLLPEGCLVNPGLQQVRL